MGTEVESRFTISYGSKLNMTKIVISRKGDSHIAERWAKNYREIPPLDGGRSDRDLENLLETAIALGRTLGREGK